MAGFSYPFDDGPGSTITEDQWSHLMMDAVGTGVHEVGEPPGPKSNELRVFSLAEPGLIYVYGGRATIQGFHYHQSGTETITVTANSNPTQDRIDAIVLRLDLATNAITLETKPGSPADNPVPPAITASELVLATFRVRKNSSLVLANEVTDRRKWVGRRMGVGIASDFREGDVYYSPNAERWFGIDPVGSPKGLAFTSELQDHVNASDPHPQYLTSSEGNAAYNVTGGSVDLSFDPLWENIGYTWRKLNLPGGYGIVNFYIWTKYTGVTTDESPRIGTLTNPSYYPNYTHIYVAHQWIYSNSTDDIPMLVAVNADGTVQARNLRVMGGAFLNVGGTYFTGPGV